MSEVHELQLQATPEAVALRFGAPGQGPELRLTRDAATALLAQLEAVLGPAPAATAATPPKLPAADPLDSLLTDGIAPELLQRGRTPLNLPPDPASAAADRLIAAVKALGTPVRHERSLRLQPGRMQAHRFLLTVLPRQVAGDALARVAAVGHVMNMPAAVSDWLQQAPRDAAAIHFGFEGDGERSVVKLYVERPAVPGPDGAPVLLHEACKWTLGSDRHVLSRYHWFPGLEAAAIGARVQALLAMQPQALQLALQALASAEGRPGLQYLEVNEPGQPRASFDLNLYDAGLEVRALQPLLAGARDAFALPPGRFQVLYDQIKSRRLGHLAGGLHRDGQPFFTLYFGVTTWPPS